MCKTLKAPKQIKFCTYVWECAQRYLENMGPALPKQIKSERYVWECAPPEVLEPSLRRWHGENVTQVRRQDLRQTLDEGNNYVRHLLDYSLSILLNRSRFFLFLLAIEITH